MTCLAWIIILAAAYELLQAITYVYARFLLDVIISLGFQKE